MNAATNYPEFAYIDHAELQALQRVHLEHPVIAQCERQLRGAISLAAGYDIMLVVGPTGVGKTTLRRALLDPARAAKLKAPRVAAPDGSIPVVSVTAHNGRNFVSRWKQLLQDILKIVNPVLFDFGKVPDPFAPNPTNTGKSFEHVSIARLLSLVIEALRLRKTRTVFVDEAQHLAPVASREDYSLMAESLKELGSNSQTVLVLFGTYTLLSFLEVSGQLARRSSPVHFRRYLPTLTGSHLEAAQTLNVDNPTFLQIFSGFSKTAPTLLPATLRSSLPFLYCGSLGCTGVLKDWLVRAAGEAVLQGLEAVTPALLEATALPVGSLVQMRTEAEFGERQYAKLFAPMNSFMLSVLHAGGSPAPASPSGPKPLPGTRKLKRDPSASSGK